MARRDHQIAQRTLGQTEHHAPLPDHFPVHGRAMPSNARIGRPRLVRGQFAMVQPVSV
ncbi:MAG: hypothetical protein M9900_13965 [Flavobacteriales bacterium]|nr:hypothetical protein [Flavobacteriales bacterium]